MIIFVCIFRNLKTWKELFNHLREKEEISMGSWIEWIHQMGKKFCQEEELRVERNFQFPMKENIRNDLFFCSVKC